MMNLNDYLIRNLRWLMRYRVPAYLYGVLSPNISRSEIIDRIIPSVPHMQNFQTNTLARLLVSFVPLADFLIRHPITPLRVASFGAGSCSHESFLADMYPAARICCFDSSSKYIPSYTRAKINSKRNFNFYEATLELLDWNKYRETYDFVFSIQTLEHINNYDIALKNFASTVVRGGYIYIDTPFYSEHDEQEDQSYLERERKRQWEVHSHYHLGFSLYRMAERIKALGFEIVDLGYSSYRDGDAKFLDFIRKSGTFDRIRSSPDLAISMVGLFHELLIRHEEMYRSRFNELDGVRHAIRPMFAIRILAQKCV